MEEWPQFFYDKAGEKAKRRKWGRYDPEVEQTIRSAYQAGRPSVNIAMHWTDNDGVGWVSHYTIDLTPGAMTQTSDETGFARRVKMQAQPAD